MQFRILGPLEVLGDDGGTVDVGGDKRRAFLAVLLVHANRVVSVDELIRALWGHDPPSRAKGTIQAHVSRLRRVLPGSVLVTRSPGYLLRLEPDQLDSSVFERMVGEARNAAENDAYGAASDRLATALSSWRGSALVDFCYEDWAQPTIGRLEDLRLSALEDRLEADLNMGRHQSVGAEAEELVARHPLRERLWGFLMLARYRSGRQADALRTFTLAQTTLGEELGIEPSSLLRTLENQILMQDPVLDLGHQDSEAIVPAEARSAQAAPPADIAGNLPSPLTSFVGRRAERDDVAVLLGQERLVTLTGPGGAGKTRLALECARAVAGEWPGGAWFVDLSALTEPDRVPFEFAAELGLERRTTRTVEDARLALRAHLGGERCALIVDNCEQVVDDVADLVHDLVSHCPDLAVLATSRCPLGIPGEVVWVMPTLGLPGQDDPIDRIMAADAIDLFLERAKLARPDWRPDDAELPHIAEICRALDGIPLALELAAALLRTRSVESILRGLDDRFALLDGRQRGVPARHQTLASMLEDAVDRLGEPSRELFVRLGVFAAGFDQEAALSIGGQPGAALDELIDASLVFVEYPAGEPRFGLLETVKAYAQQALVSAGVDSVTRAAHARYYANWADMADQHTATDEGVWLDRMRLEHDNVRGALAWTRSTGSDDVMVQLAASYGWFWLVRGLLDEGRRWVEAALAVADPEHDRYRDLLGAAGYLSGEQGDLSATMRYLERTLAIDEAIGDPGPIAASLSNLAKVARMRGDLRTSRDLARRAIELVEAIDSPSDFDVRRRASVSINLADALFQLGEYQQSGPLYERVLELAIESHALYETGRAQFGLAELALEVADYEEVESRLAAGFATAEQAGDLTLRSSLEELTGWLAHDRGDREAALEAAQRAVEAAAAAGTYQESSAVYASAALFAEEVCLTAEADDYIARAIESSASGWRQVHVDEIRAWHAVRRGEMALAIELIDTADTICRKTGTVRGRLLRAIADQTRSDVATAAP